ncbi:protein ROOT PRIMORDIUM DEFECTIVE 1 [Phalaenopsis equestris]|uniref:protein ROOT PRIMORDIUM DEFECTIVE 1 n=1 Tax=Phalaenopsis equestris TaxID=78828 RepID=UPI0009E2AB1F|nr:protein ROOT PRIMORDIUM DEFECTIVE 1 [Phalaenopsis equestris]
MSMLSLFRLLSSSHLVPKTLNARVHPIFKLLHRSMGVSSLKVAWRKDPMLDAAIERDKGFRLCSRVIREVLNEPGHRIPLRYLEKRRERLDLPIRTRTFLSRYPNLLELYDDRIKPSSPPVPFLRPSPRLLSFLSLQSSISSRLEPLVLSKLCKLLMMSRHRVLPAHKLLSVKRDFGFPDDFLVSLVPRHAHLLRLVGSSGHHLELVSWPEEHARSTIELRTEEESRVTGVRMRPNFSIRLPKGFYLRREMREWTRDWLEMPYISPYEDASKLHPASPEMEKRNVAVLHELLSLSVTRRMAVPVVGKFCEEYRFSNEFGNTFTRHPGIFYVSLKGGIKTAMLREAYDEHGELVDRDPYLEIKDKFVEMMEEGHREWKEMIKAKREAVQKDLELMARKNAELSVGEYETCIVDEDQRHSDHAMADIPT